MSDYQRDYNYNDPQEELDCECGQDPCICPHPVGCRCGDCEDERGDYLYHLNKEE